jgi:hypothetical protein
LIRGDLAPGRAPLGRIADLPDNTLCLLDTETGGVMPVLFAGARRCFRASCSPWRDGEGQYHLLARASDASSEGYSLVRYTFPARRILSDVRITTPLLGDMCWFPDRSDRILFAGSDRRLYRFRAHCNRYETPSAILGNLK